MAKKKAILDLYERVLEDSKISPQYRKLLNVYCELEEEFFNEVDDVRKKKYEIMENLLREMSEIENREFFAEGFVLAAKLITEIYYNEENK